MIAELYGMRFGKLLVLGLSLENKRGRKAYRCICECGGEIIALPNELRKGSIVSCGCYHGVTRLANGEGAFGQLYNNYKQNAKKRVLAFELSKVDFRKLVTSNCYYCGSEPNQIYGRTTRNNGTFRYIGLDRVDNSKGYTIDNCVACCMKCNQVKGSISVEMIEKIHRLITRTATAS